MTYKERFAASEERAHYQNIATKILREMTELRSRVESSPISAKRWIWELIQNAKDVNIDGKVRIRIEVQLNGDDPHVTFKHNGKPFSAENIRFLIEQVSSKDRKKDLQGRPKTTGKFGTGFLTTHLLSEVVLVQGVAKEENLEARQFEMVLDRSGTDLDTITEAVKTAKNSVQGLDDAPAYEQYVAGAFNTTFRYELGDDTGRVVAKAGIIELDACMAYALAFVSEIESIDLLTRQYRLDRTSVVPSDEGVQILSVAVTNSSNAPAVASHSLAVMEEGFTTIAVPIEITGERIQIIKPGPEIPRLFCDFPLLGTESFPFPVVINNPNFNPTDARDGVFLTHTTRNAPQIDENKKIVKEALSLFFSLLNYASKNSWDNLHFFASVRSVPSDLTWIDPSWYKDEVLTPIRKTLLRTNIVRTATGELASIISTENKKQVWFPSGTSKEIRERIWQSCNSWFPEHLPVSADVEAWHSLIWDECGKLTIAKLAEFVESAGTIDALSKELTGKDAYQWLDEFHALLKLDEDEYDSLINKRRLFPNQNGDFCKRAELYRDAGDIDLRFKEILESLGINVRAELFASEIEVDFDGIRERNQAYVVKEITSQVEEKTADREVAKGYQPAFRRLLLWFRENPARATSLFPILYRQKHLLYNDDEILENIERAEELTELLAEYDVSNVYELRSMLAKHHSASEVLPVTQEIIATMGITSVEEWQEALKDKDLALLFSHKSTPTTDMFVYAQSQIRQAKERIISHLRTLPDYDLSEMDETAPTVLAGIQKDGRSLMIVVRPAYDGQVIIYYGSERDVLDFEDSELWIDEQTRVRRITLGHILKSAQIRKFPV
jgi:hypothetical protein